jgi:hypothetical protein
VPGILQGSVSTQRGVEAPSEERMVGRREQGTNAPQRFEGGFRSAVI